MKKLTEKISHVGTIRLFAIVINTWIIGNTLILLPGHKSFWARGSYLPSQDFSSFSTAEKFIGILSHPDGIDFYPVIIALQLFFAASAIVGRQRLVSQLIVLWATLTLDHRVATLMDGGNNLIHLLLIYLPLMQINPNEQSNSPLRVSIVNLAFLTARLQVVLVYLTAGLCKIHGELWPKGVALYYTMGVAEYGDPALAKLMSNYPLLSVGSSYATLAFQISLPFLIWNRNLRPLYLILGTFFHLGIAFGMGLVSFGFAMCTSYFIFYTEDRAQALLAQVRNWFKPEKLIAGFDENCRPCQNFAKMVALLDWQNCISIDRARSPENNVLAEICPAEKLRELQVVNSAGLASGYAAIHLLLFSLPLFRPFSLFSYLLLISGAGQKIYLRFFSEAGWPTDCKESLCKKGTSKVTAVRSV